MIKPLRSKWASKLLRTKNFIVITDTEAVICLKGKDPADFNDMVLLSAQAAELSKFRESLDVIIKRHKEIYQGTMGSKMKVAKAKSAKAPKKIKVKG